MLTRLVLATLFLAACLASALAAPARIIILRHGEKADDWKLCAVGVQRAEALARNYLGRGAAKSLFAAREEPAALYAITLHTLQLLSPAAATWDKPITLYSAVPEPGQTPGEFNKALNRRTQEAARHVLADPALAGKTIVMVWEHHHIANAALEAKFPEGDAAPAPEARYPTQRAGHLAHRDLRLFLDRGFRQIRHAGQILDAEAGVRRKLSGRALQRLGQAGRSHRRERLRNQAGLIGD